jgi:hypothetical protein
VVFVKLTKETSNPYEGEYTDSKGATGSKQKPTIVISASSNPLLKKVLGIAGEEAFRTVVDEGIKGLIHNT